MSRIANGKTELSLGSQGQSEKVINRRSRGEENPSPFGAARGRRTLDGREAQGTVLPLPRGEGRGEGERRFRRSRVVALERTVRWQAHFWRKGPIRAFSRRLL